ncbi:hypothetical protein [Actinomadura roseirufa]|uniref:hypothetical protein n=1 Tax=Actinomadura roseirufa TaxID=2094049 RepID=UPI00104122F6|nr:hypothetical protein [Actinomadura roseirufa]
MREEAEIEALLRGAGESLRLFWEATEYDTLDDLEEDEDQLRETYAAVQAVAPDDPTSAVCLTVLALGRLRAHLNGEYDIADDPFEAPDDPPAGLATDDELGRDLATDVVRAAQRTLDLQPADNLAAFALACASHWLGDLTPSTSAYRQALQLDPHDDVARARIEALDNVTLAEPPTPIASHHPYGFHLLEMTHVVGHSGSLSGRVWLLNEPSAVREAADGYLDEWFKYHGLSLDEEFGLWTHLPGRPIEEAPLRDALQQDGNGHPAIDWSKVTLPSLGDHRLPVGHPIRWLGQLHFFGRTEHDD